MTPTPTSKRPKKPLSDRALATKLSSQLGYKAAHNPDYFEQSILPLLQDSITRLRSDSVRTEFVAEMRDIAKLRKTELERISIDEPITQHWLAQVDTCTKKHKEKLQKLASAKKSIPHQNAEKLWDKTKEKWIDLQDTIKEKILTEKNKTKAKKIAQEIAKKSKEKAAEWTETLINIVNK